MGVLTPSAIMLRLGVGDVVTLTHPKLDLKATALVTGITKNFANVTVLGVKTQLRIHDQTRYRAGTLVGQPGWELDLSQPVQKPPPRRERPERAVGMLSRVREGDYLPIVGYYPFDGQLRWAKVAGVERHRIRVALTQRRRAWMTRTGPLAGIIHGEPWTLDTVEGRDRATEETTT